MQEKLFSRVPSVLGEFGKVCVVILPGTMALFLQEHKASGRGSEKLPGGACRTHFLWLEPGRVMERQEESVCVHRPSEGLAASPWVCCVPVCRSGPQSTQTPCALVEHHVEPPSASQEQGRESCLLFLSC